MEEKTLKVWMNGVLVDTTKASVPIGSRTIQYGFGVFEGIKCYDTEKGPAVFRLEEHTKRLFKSAKILDLKIPYTKKQINNAVKKTIRENELKACYIRPIVYLGDASLGLDIRDSKVHLAIIAKHWPKYLDGDPAEGIKVMLSSYTRHNDALQSGKICGNYANLIAAKREALENGCEETLMFDGYKNVVEGSSENIFIVKDGTIITPELGNILSGVTRDSVIDISRNLGYEVKESTISLDDFLEADEAFFTGTAAELMPISLYKPKNGEDIKIGSGKRGFITEIIQKEFFDIIAGKDEKYHDWLDFV